VCTRRVEVEGKMSVEEILVASVVTCRFWGFWEIKQVQ
jgi:hypothetical protein